VVVSSGVPDRQGREANCAPESFAPGMPPVGDPYRSDLPTLGRHGPGGDSRLAMTGSTGLHMSECAPSAA
jgi:hypothetical protein